MRKLVRQDGISGAAAGARRIPERQGRGFLLFALFFLSGTLLFGQILDPSSDGRPRSGDPDFDASTDRRAGPQEQREAIVDTFGIFQYQVDNPNSEESWRDSLLDQFQRYEPSRKPDFDYATTGTRGGAAYPLRYQPITRTGTTERERLAMYARELSGCW